MRASDVQTAFGEVLRETRVSRGISQEQLALDADVDRSFVSQIERGVRQPTLTTIFKLASALGIRPSILVSGTESRLR